METIDIDAIESAYIEQMIEDNWWSPFPTVQETERPDTVAASLIEGRVAIIVTIPLTLLVPANINMFMVSPEMPIHDRKHICALLRFGANLLLCCYREYCFKPLVMLPTVGAVYRSYQEAVPSAYAEAF